MVLISGYVQVKRAELTSDFGEEVSVVVAAKDIPEYSMIRADMLTTKTVFKDFLQPQTVTEINDIVGKSAFVPISGGEQITLTKLITQDGKPVLDRQLERAKRAVTIVISPQTGVGRLVRPGNRVDVLTAASYDSNNQTMFEVKTVVQNVLVLATGRNIQNEVPTRVNRAVLSVLKEEFENRPRKDYYGAPENLSTSRPDDSYSTVTLQVFPDDAEKLLYLSHTFGDRSLYLTLRNSADQNTEKLETVLLDDVLGPDSDYGRSKKKPLPIVEPKARFYDIIGGKEVPR